MQTESELAKYLKSGLTIVVSVGSRDVVPFWSKMQETFRRLGTDLVLLWLGQGWTPTGFVPPVTKRIQGSAQRSLIEQIAYDPEAWSLLHRVAYVLDREDLVGNGNVVLFDGEADDTYLNPEAFQDLFETLSREFFNDRISIPASLYSNRISNTFVFSPVAGARMELIDPTKLIGFRYTAENSELLEELLREASGLYEYRLVHSIVANPSRFAISKALLGPLLADTDLDESLFKAVPGWNFSKQKFDQFSSESTINEYVRSWLEGLSHPLVAQATDVQNLVGTQNENSVTQPRIDDVMRHVVRRDMVDPDVDLKRELDSTDSLMSSLFNWLNLPSEDHDWLSRYWRGLLLLRPDVVQAFPDLESWDRPAFLDWATETLRVENSNPLIARPAKSGLGMRWDPSVGSGAPVNVQVVGYLRRESSLGDVARRLVAEISPAISQTGMLAYDRTMSPRLEWTPNRDGEWQKAETGTTIDTSVIVVNSDQLGYLLADLPMVQREAKSLIGYWYWELETPPKDSDLFDEILDEIWVGSTFVQKSVESGASIPVRYVPLPVGKPETSESSRQDLGLPNDAFVFTTTFDFYSVGERKNPEGSIVAFKEAFPTPSSNVALVIKTMHANDRRQEMVKLKALADGRSDIVFVDGVLDREDQHRLLELSDCLVSLHRSEGFGLHLAEAMHLGTPVIATRYSANLDFMDDDSSLLVDYTMSHPSGDQSVYPTDSEWADPDIKNAAQQMRRLFEDSDLQQRMSRAGKARIEAFDEMARHLVRDHISRITTNTMEPMS